MIYGESMKLVFFGRGYRSVDLLPYIDYESIKEKPKLLLSHSDGTSILNAIYVKVGVTTYYDVGMYLTCLGQSRLMEQVTGLLFGHYSDEITLQLFEILERFGAKYSISVANGDDFGHGSNHAIFSMGRRAVLDTKNKTLPF